MAGSSSSPQVGQKVFSLDSQAGVMHLLASIRASELTPAVKNELRDLVFLYTNGGHDESVRITLEQKLSNLSIEPVAKKAKTSDDKERSGSQRPTIGTLRTKPTFKVNRVDDVVDTTKREEPAVSAQPQIETPATPAESVSVKVDVTPAADTPSAQSSDDSKEAVVNPKTTIPTSSLIDGSVLDRIKTIKSEVNDKVGNPVHLVDLNPDLGRQYMSALLEAMKKVNSGSKATEAMEALEAAHKEIMQSDFSSASAEPEPKPEAPPATAAVDVEGAKRRAALLDDSEKDTADQPAPMAARAPKMSTDRPLAETRSFAPPVVDTPSYNETSTVKASAAPLPLSQSKHDESATVPITSTPRTTFATESTDSPATTKVTAPLGEAAPAQQPPVTPSDTFSSPLVKGRSTEDTTQGDPLHVPAVDAGLEQLLEEWPIFKKSGLFGTGPKGREHPLFKKIAGLQIPLLLAGRFEGATQEIKQSITDYMNGWRYEQGLIYEQGETFEHYLRRVIRHILDLQKSKM